MNNLFNLLRTLCMLGLAFNQQRSSAENRQQKPGSVQVAEVAKNLFNKSVCLAKKYPLPTFFLVVFVFMAIYAKLTEKFYITFEYLGKVTLAQFVGNNRYKPKRLRDQTVEAYRKSTEKYFQAIKEAVKPLIDKTKLAPNEKAPLGVTAEEVFKQVERCLKQLKRYEKEGYDKKNNQELKDQQKKDQIYYTIRSMRGLEGRIRGTQGKVADAKVETMQEVRVSVDPKKTIYEIKKEIQLMIGIHPDHQIFSYTDKENKETLENANTLESYKTIANHSKIEVQKQELLLQSGAFRYNNKEKEILFKEDSAYKETVGEEIKKIVDQLNKEPSVPTEVPLITPAAHKKHRPVVTYPVPTTKDNRKKSLKEAFEPDFKNLELAMKQDVPYEPRQINVQLVLADVPNQPTYKYKIEPREMTGHQLIKAVYEKHPDLLGIQDPEQPVWLVHDNHKLKNEDCLVYDKPKKKSLVPKNPKDKKPKKKEIHEGDFIFLHTKEPTSAPKQPTTIQEYLHVSIQLPNQRVVSYEVSEETTPEQLLLELKKKHRFDPDQSLTWIYQKNKLTSETSFKEQGVTTNAFLKLFAGGDGDKPKSYEKLTLKLRYRDRWSIYEIGRKETLQTFQKKIEQQEGVPIDAQRLIFSPEMLRSDQKNTPLEKILHKKIKDKKIKSIEASELPLYQLQSVASQPFVLTNKQKNNSPKELCVVYQGACHMIPLRMEDTLEELQVKIGKEIKLKKDNQLIYVHFDPIKNRTIKQIKDDFFPHKLYLFDSTKKIKDDFFKSPPLPQIKE